MNDPVAVLNDKGAIVAQLGSGFEGRLPLRDGRAA